MDEAQMTAIRRWLTKAENDLKTARATLAQSPEVTDTICFHAQQCAEKALKAFLTWAGVHVEKTHYLPILLEKCALVDAEFQSLEEHAKELTDYAVEVRYIDDWREIPLEEAEVAMRRAEEVLRYVMIKLPLEHTDK